MVFKCNMKNCQRYYHLKCLFTKEYEGRFADKAGKVVKDITEKSIIFRCPAHYCFACYGKDLQLSKSKPVTCALCSMTLHLKCTTDNQFLKLRRSTYICRSHLGKNLSFNLVEEYKVFWEKRTFTKKSIKEKLFSNTPKPLLEG